jgi:hypothetical protein
MAARGVGEGKMIMKCQKLSLIILGLIITMTFMAACMLVNPDLIPTALQVATITQTNSPIQTNAILITPIITATPLLADISTETGLRSLLERIYSYGCMAHNLAEPPFWVEPHVSALNITEADIDLDPIKYWISERADNIIGNYHAFVACDPSLCQEKLYVLDDLARKTYEIDWEARMPWRPIQWITWINNDTLAFLQTANPENAELLAVNYQKREIVFEAVIYPSYYCATVTPTK